MADELKGLLKVSVPSAATGRGIIVSAVGTLSSTLRPYAVTYDSTDAGIIIGQGQVAGTCLVKLGGTVAKGDNVKSTATGVAVVATLGTDHNIIGTMEEGGAINELRSMLIAKS